MKFFFWIYMVLPGTFFFFCSGLTRTFQQQNSNNLGPNGFWKHRRSLARNKNNIRFGWDHTKLALSQSFWKARKKCNINLIDGFVFAKKIWWKHFFFSAQVGRDRKYRNEPRVFSHPRGKFAVNPLALHEEEEKKWIMKIRRRSKLRGEPDCKKKKNTVGRSTSEGLQRDNGACHALFKDGSNHHISVGEHTASFKMICCLIKLRGQKRWQAAKKYVFCFS